jgi:hypothetical protein
VSSLDHIAAEIIVSHNGAAYRTYADSIALDTHFIDNLAKNAVNDTMSTARAVMCRNV